LIIAQASGHVCWQLEKIMSMGIYKIESPSGSFYIGSSTNVERRLRTHRRELLSGTHINSALRNAASKYGVDAMSFCQIASVPNRVDLRGVEQQMLDSMLPEYNISKKADCALFDDEVIKKRISSVSREVVRLQDGKVFLSARDAAKEHGQNTPDNLSTAIRRGWKFAGHFWKYQEDKTTLEDAQKRWAAMDAARFELAKNNATKARSKMVRRLSDGVVFASATEASKAVGGHKKMVSEAISLIVVRGGSRWEYV